MNIKQFNKSLLATALLALAQSAVAADVSVKITNLTNGNHFTPVLVTAHTDGTHLFQAGTVASTSLTAMAECGDISSLLTDMGGVDADTIENPAAGLLAPGASTTADLMTTAANTHLSIVAMVLPTNDAFVGLDSMMLPTTVGTYTYYLNAYDAGTEANDELLPGTDCAPGVAGIPAAPGMDGGENGTGVAMTDTNTMVHVHRGVLGDSDDMAGKSDLNNTVHRWQNPVAKVIVTVK